MRSLMLVALATLAGCAQPALRPAEPLGPAGQQAVERLNANPELRARLDNAVATGRRREEEARANQPPEQRAWIICNSRGQTVAAQPQYTGPGLAGAIESAAQTSQSGRAVAEICWRTYQSTGVMPSY
jgi:hypothetical protein